MLAVGSGGGSALRAAVDANDRDVVKAALAAGAAADEVGADGQTAVLYATLAKKYKAVNALLAAGADPNIGDAAGRTALHHAALNGDAPLAKWLLSMYYISRTRSWVKPTIWLPSPPIGLTIHTGAQLHGEPRGIC